MTQSRLEPAPVPGLGDVVEISAGEDATCARTSDGSLSCWGIARWNKLFVDSGEMCGQRPCRTHPARVEGLDRVIDVAVGDGHICAARSDGALVCWGANTFGQLGDGTTTDRTLPTPVAW